jgi:tetratricopeptide (TPR) repeat protein
VTTPFHALSVQPGPFVASLRFGVLVSALALASLAAAVTPEESLSRARRASSDGASEVASGILDRLLSGSDVPAKILQEAGLLRAEIFLRRGESAQAERVLAERGDPGAVLVLAQVAMRAERWWTAAARFAAAREAGADPRACVLGRATALGRLGLEKDALAELREFAARSRVAADVPVGLAVAGLLLDLGKTGEARQVIDSIRASASGEWSAVLLLDSRVALGEGRLEEASAGFIRIVEGMVPVPPEVFAGAYLGQAAVLEARGEHAAAAKWLLRLLMTGRELSCAESLFQRATQILSELVDLSAADLESCTRSGPKSQQALALFYLAQFYTATGSHDKAAASLVSFSQQFPGHRLIPASLLQRAEMSMVAGRWEDAEALLKDALILCEEPKLTGIVRMRQGLTYLRLGDAEKALASFDAAVKVGPELRVEAGFNAGLAAVRLGDLKRVQTQQEMLKNLPGTADLVASLELETAIHRAAKGKERAHELLQAFVLHHPSHPRVGDAKVALAELLVRESVTAAGDNRATASGAMRDRASALLKAVAVDPQSPQSAMQAKYLAVFIADSGGSGQAEDVLTLGDAFLREYPDSVLSNQMRMKLGEVYFRRKDFANAEEQFAGIASREPEGTLSETALFLAGQCAANRLNPGSVDDALRYWEQVAQGNGSLRWRARYQQAAVKSRVGEDADGAELFGRIINSVEAVDAELRFAARCGKADALLSMAKRGAVPLSEALAEYEALASQPQVPPMWRNQALYKKAKAVEAAQQQESLEGFYRVLDAPDSAEAGEFFWLFKAGFDAARILEARQSWRDCVALYERLGRLGGPRSQDAKNRAFQIRLERFIWE